MLLSYAPQRFGEKHTACHLTCRIISLSWECSLATVMESCAYCAVQQCYNAICDSRSIDVSSLLSSSFAVCLTVRTV